jgi:hypothetical protein
MITNFKLFEQQYSQFYINNHRIKTFPYDLFDLYAIFEAGILLTTPLILTESEIFYKKETVEYIWQNKSGDEEYLTYELNDKNFQQEFNTLPFHQWLFPHLNSTCQPLEQTSPNFKPTPFKDALAPNNYEYDITFHWHPKIKQKYHWYFATKRTGII